MYTLSAARLCATNEYHPDAIRVPLPPAAGSPRRASSLRDVLQTVADQRPRSAIQAHEDQDPAYLRYYITVSVARSILQTPWFTMFAKFYGGFGFRVTQSLLFLFLFFFLDLVIGFWSGCQARI